MTLSKRDRELIDVDGVQVEVQMGLAMWDFVLGQCDDNDETTKTIRKRCRRRLEDLLPNIMYDEPTRQHPTVASE